MLIELSKQLALDAMAVLFVVSGVAKLLTLRDFQTGLLFIPYMRITWSYVIGYGMPFLELALAVSLYLNLWLAKLLAIGLLLSFCSVTAVVLHHRLRVPCNCFTGFGDEGFSIATIKRNGLLILITTWTFGLDDRIGLLLPPIAAATGWLLFLSVLTLSQNFKAAGAQLRLSRA